MTGGFKDLREFIAFLEKKGDLVRVKREVDPVLEVNAILDKLARTNGPAVLFENVKGSDIPLFGNAFGTYRRLSWAFGTDNLRKLEDERLEVLLDMVFGPSQDVLLALKAKGIATKFKNFRQACKTMDWKKAAAFGKTGMNMLPKAVSKKDAPCKEVILTGSDIDLTKFPLIKCWPLDGSRYVTLPLIITRDPENGAINVGIYRMMLLDKDKLCMHWLPQKHGQQHYAKAERLNQEMPVVVAVGADPALEVMGGLVLMTPLDEFGVAGMLKGSPVTYTQAEDSDLWVPASAEIVFEGIVKPNERVDEGPFGEFHGYYSPVKQTPVFHIKKITMRKKPIWHAATTGMPPTEIHVMAKAMEGLAVNISNQFFPGVKDVNMTVESGTLYTVVLSFQKRRAYEAQDLQHFMWAAATQSAIVTNLVIVDPDVDTHDMAQVFRAIALHVRPDQDLAIMPRGMADMEKPSTYPRGISARMGIDATTKWPEEGFVAEATSVDPALQSLIEAKWKDYGPSLTAIHCISEGPTLSILAALKKSKPFEAQDVMRFFWKLAKGSTARVNVFVVDDTIDPKDMFHFFWALSMNMRPEQDVYISPKAMPQKGGPFPPGMGMDATVKTFDEGLKRDMPELVTMDKAVMAKVEKHWKDYGF